MRLILALICFLGVATTARSSLLEMSQTLWNKALAGGLTKIGILDPLRIPVVKVDQTEGDVSYRMILRGVEIMGLNSSRLESIHIARGRLRANLSDSEAGYVSYNDRNQLDMIRYRFHTVLKEPRIQESQDLRVKSISELDETRRRFNPRARRPEDFSDSVRDRSYDRFSRYRENQERINPGEKIDQESFSRYENRKEQGERFYPSTQNSRRFGPESSSQNARERFSSDESQVRINPAVKIEQESFSRYENRREQNDRFYPSTQNSRRFRPESSSQNARERFSSDERQERINPNVKIDQESFSRYENRREQNDRRFYPSTQNSRRFGPESSSQNARERFSSDESQERINPGVKIEQESFSRYENRKEQDERRIYPSTKNSEGSGPEFSSPYAQFSSDRSENRGMKNIPGRVRLVYPERNSNDNQYGRTTRPLSVRVLTTSECPGDCGKKRENLESDDIGTAATVNFGNRAYVDVKSSNPQRTFEDPRAERIRSDDDRYASTFDIKFGQTDEPDRPNVGQYRDKSSSERMESRPGFVDIVYADDKDKKIRHFGNLRVEPGQETKVYSLKDVLQDLRDRKRFIIHNFTEGEALTKKNNVARIAIETKRIKDLVRYAKEFQEKNGFYEEGMELIYHYGNEKEGVLVEGNDSKRSKRAHTEEENDDDIMHVILKISVPTLQVDAGYVLAGKVGDQVLRGNGQLSANFTELIGDFTLELKKVDNDTMIVRAARARLSSKDKAIVLQGMNEEGPVNEILSEGLLAAEAVAAMLADDLATKALSEKTADSIIYRMYKDFPAEN